MEEGKRREGGGGGEGKRRRGRRRGGEGKKREGEGGGGRTQHIHLQNSLQLLQLMHLGKVMSDGSTFSMT